MVADISRYNIELSKGTGLIQETLALLNLFDPALSKKELIRIVEDSNALVKASSNRIKDIVSRVFYKRFVEGNPAVPSWLRQLNEKYVGLEVMRQLFYMYTCRANKILFDFIVEDYWPVVSSGVKALGANQPAKFIKDANQFGRVEEPWSPGTQRRMANYLKTALIDFKLIDEKKNILPFYLNELVANYLIHEMHFRHLSDDDVFHADEWRLFGVDGWQLKRTFEKLSLQGHFIFQSSGELIKITWNYKNMQEFIDGTTR